MSHVILHRFVIDNIVTFRKRFKETRKKQVERLVCPSTCDVVDANWQLLFLFRLLLCWQLHDEAVQILRQALLVVVDLLGGHEDGLQRVTTYKST